MILSDGKIRPGRVLHVENEKGIIKVCCPGLFSDQDDPEKLPPVYPWFNGNSNNFSKVNEDDEVWVMFFEHNPYELFWFRKDNIGQNLGDILNKDYEHIEVVCSKELDSGYAQIYYTDGDGWIIRRDETFIQLDKDGNVIIDTGRKHRAISIDDNSISLGTVGGSAEPAVLGDKLEDCLNKLYDLLDAGIKAGQPSPYTASMCLAMQSAMGAFKTSITKIKSNHVTLD